MVKKFNHTVFRLDRAKKYEELIELIREKQPIEVDKLKANMVVRSPYIARSKTNEVISDMLLAEIIKTDEDGKICLS